jgi:SAM-dependent methyltransferase
MPEEFPITGREIQLINAKRMVLSAARRAIPGTRRRLQDAAKAAPIARPPLEVPVPADMQLTIEEFSFYRGVLCVRGSASSTVSVTGAGFFDRDGTLHRMVDTVPALQDGEESQTIREFAFEIRKNDHEIANQVALALYLDSRRVIRVEDISGLAAASNPVGKLNARFHEIVRGTPTPAVLEIGSRSRSGNVYRDWMPAGCRYTGFDVLEGPNVDVVGDAHTLSKHFEADQFDAVYAISTFEHLAMPWVAAAEINRVMKPGGVVFIATHQTWPVHDAPWDFYRFSEYAWVTLFNSYSGFEIISAAMGEPGQIVANVANGATLGLELQPAFLSSAVLARKVGSTDLKWDADVAAVVESAYPI